MIEQFIADHPHWWILIASMIAVILCGTILSLADKFRDGTKNIDYPDNMWMIFIGLVTIAEGLVIVGSLGFWKTPGWRLWASMKYSRRAYRQYKVTGE